MVVWADACQKFCVIFFAREEVYRKLCLKIPTLVPPWYKVPTPRRPRYEILGSIEPPWCVAPPTAVAGHSNPATNIKAVYRAYHVWLTRDRAYHG